MDLCDSMRATARLRCPMPSQRLEIEVKRYKMAQDRSIAELTPKPRNAGNFLKKHLNSY
jgi:hypothetical protein